LSARRAARAYQQVTRAEAANDQEGVKRARYAFLDRLHRLVEVRKAMVAEGMTPPWLDQRWFADMKQIEEEG
jgi:hypothetical protein